MAACSLQVYLVSLQGYLETATFLVYIKYNAPSQNRDISSWISGELYPPTWNNVTPQQCDKLFNSHQICINTSICIVLERQLKGKLLKLDQSGFKVCTHTCTQWCRGATWLVTLFSAFTETATSEATQGAAILDLSSGVTWLLLLLCEGHQSDPVSKRCVILPHRDTLFYGGG